MSTQLAPIEQRVMALEDSFNQVNAYKMNFKKEANFALQLLKANSFLRDVAQKNPDSLQAAITNIAAIGISLNPASKEAYLVPRGGMICLDISYMGLANLATKDGHLFWVQAEVVKSNDDFKLLGFGKPPHHDFKPFGDRGEIVGVYCVGKTTTGEYLTTTMTKAECDSIRDKCSKGSTSWKDFYEEMLKKTVIKRASKLWPKSERLDTAINVLNEHEGIEFNKGGAFAAQPSEGTEASEATFKNIRDLLAFNKRSEEQLLKYINGKFKTELKSIEEMEPVHIEEAYRAMGGSK